MDAQLESKKTKHVTLPIYNLSCGGGGSLTVERILMHTPGVIEVYVNPATEMAYITYDPCQSTPDLLTAVIERAGFGLRKASNPHLPAHS